MIRFQYETPEYVQEKLNTVISLSKYWDNQLPDRWSSLKDLLNQFNKFATDYGLLLKEIKDKLGFELNLRKNADAHKTDLNYRPENNFERDLEILSYWEELPNRPYKEIANRFGVSEDTARKALKRTYELIYDKSFHHTKNKVKNNTDSLCDSCPPQQKNKCQTPCDELEADLGLITKKRDWRELLT